jgi:hypothetical protein
MLDLIAASPRRRQTRNLSPLMMRPSIVIPANAGIQLPKGPRMTASHIIIPADAEIQLAAS